ncbi:hypothetical protein AGMMS50225_23500 [Betaproteobacteria bacterium]|nr:hypothetical protein AGMMS50225_23500 [Betaproteobacteria bacterium]
MIVLDLCCPFHHRFEGWFASAAEFEAQLARGLVSCPVCGAGEVRRMPSAPHVQTTHPRPAAPPPAAPGPSPASAPPDDQQALVAHLAATLRQLAQAAEDVGERFAEEARRIHYEESQVRPIRGQASRDDVEELLDEGIVVLPVPPGEDLH